MPDTNQKQLGNTLWSFADPPRGAMDADDFCEPAFLSRRFEVCHFSGVTRMIRRRTVLPTQ